VVVIRPAVDGDRTHIAALLKDCGDAGTVQISHDDSSWERFSCSYVALNGDNIVGYGSIFSRWLHPRRLRMAIHVRPDSTQNQTNDALFDRLIAAIPHPDTRGLQASYWQSDDTAHAFWSTHGFSLLMRTHIGTLDPHLLTPGDLWVPSHQNSLQIISGDEIDRDGSLWNDIARLHEAIYRQNHAWNPPALIDEDLARELFLHPDDLLPEMMHIAFESERPVAVASLRPSEQPGHCELGWIGVHSEYAGETGLVHNLLAACLADAQRRGWVIDVEIDEADPILAPMITAWPLRDRKTWLTVSRPQLPHLSS